MCKRDTVIILTLNAACPASGDVVLSSHTGKSGSDKSDQCWINAILLGEEQGIAALIIGHGKVVPRRCKQNIEQVLWLLSQACR